MASRMAALVAASTGAGGDGVTALEGRFDGLLQLGHDRFPL